jgi:FtsP/CotA-like multicopper oxidase with cupredoxin domain
MAGMFILDEADTDTDTDTDTDAGPDAARGALPNRYGVDDIPVIVQDKRLDDDNQLDASAPRMSDVGILGDLIRVNGTTAPYHRVTTERIRLRLLNASNARFYRFGFTDDRPFALIGTDGGLLPTPHATRRIQLCPAERAEIVVTLKPGERAVLRSFPPDLDLNFWDRRFNGGDDTLDILQLRAAPRLAPSPNLPRQLAEASALATTSTEVDRTFALSSFSINGKSMNMRRIDFTAPRDTTEVWEVTANDAVQHNFHIHDVQFQVLSVGGKQPPPELGGWKDTVHTPPGVPVRLALRFRDHSDPRFPYLYHCHVLYHEDEGLMSQFVVVAPGEKPGKIGGGSSHHHGPAAEL